MTSSLGRLVRTQYYFHQYCTLYRILYYMILGGVQLLVTYIMCITNSQILQILHVANYISN